MEIQMLTHCFVSGPTVRPEISLSLVFAVYDFISTSKSELYILTLLNKWGIMSQVHVTMLN